jgi:hypothetical protein
MPFFIREEKYCPTCGLPTDQCECLIPDDDKQLEELKDED